MGVKISLKSNRGSSLVMVLLISIIMTTLCIAIMMVSLSEFKMSGMFSEKNRAYLAAEAGVDQVAKVLDEWIAAVQEEAKLKTAMYIDSILTNDVTHQYTYDDGSIKHDIVKQEYDNYYRNTAFSSCLDNRFALFEASGNQEALKTAYKELLDGGSEDTEGKIYQIGSIYKFLNYDSETSKGDNSYGLMVLNSIGFDSSSTNIILRITGVYKNYKKALTELKVPSSFL